MASALKKIVGSFHKHREIQELFRKLCGKRSDLTIIKQFLMIFRFWSKDYTPKYGNCYTFNSMDNFANDPNTPRKASLTGRDYGMFFSFIN
jgi:hypothetical protein